MGVVAQCWKTILSVSTLPSAFNSHRTPHHNHTPVPSLLTDCLLLGVRLIWGPSWFLVSCSEAVSVSLLLDRMGYKTVNLSVPSTWWQQNPAIYLWWSWDRRSCSVLVPMVHTSVLPWFRKLNLKSVSSPSLTRKRLLLLPFSWKNHFA